LARIRSVKPSLRTSRVVARWPFEVRYFWVLLWGYLDDKGRGLDMPKAIAGDCFPLDDRITAGIITKWLDLMSKTKVEPGRVPPLCRYEVAGSRYIHSVYWDEHQRPNRPSPSAHPPCPVHEGLTEPLTESRSEPPLSPQVLEFEGLTEEEVEGAAREPLTEPPGPPPSAPEPPSRCPKHLDDPDPPPCGACGMARRAHATWAATAPAERARADQAARHQRAVERAETTRLAIAACRDCDHAGYLPSGAVCPHDPNAADRAARGAAAARAALTTSKGADA
jgi:hypothetical protein